MTGRADFVGGSAGVRLVPYDWAFGRDSAGQIADHWARARRGNPALFDGRVLLASGASRRVVERRGRRALWTRFFRNGIFALPCVARLWFSRRAVFNCLSMPALRSRDGAFLLGEMGRGHSCAGQLYFPCGTPDRADVDGRSRRSRRRHHSRIVEETGIHVTSGMLTPAGMSF